MFVSLLTKRLTSGINSKLMHSAMRLYSGGKDCSQTYPCVMEYRKKKLAKLECKPLQVSCVRAASECSAVKEDPCNLKPGCCGGNRFKSDPCNREGANSETKKKKLSQHLPQKSVWEWPVECCNELCPGQMPRFDTIYYSPTNKATREYQQTWIECPPLRIQKRKVCCYDSLEFPPVYRRPRGDRPKSACELDRTKLKDLHCQNVTKKCPRLTMPCCRGARYPPKCNKNHAPSNCKKKCCPYPSFSECSRPCPRAKPPVECTCTQQSPKCIAFSYLNRKLKYKLPPPLPAWPPKMQGPI